MAPIADQIAAVKKWAPVYVAEMRAQGFPEKVIPFCISQMMAEAEYFTSNVFRNNAYNAAGIKFYGQAGAQKGTMASVKTDGKNPGYQARFESVAAFVRDYRDQFLARMKYDNHIKPPIKAETLAEFSRLLYLNHYHQRPEAEYTAALKARFSRLVKWIGWPLVEKKKNSGNIPPGYKPWNWLLYTASQV